MNESVGKWTVFLHRLLKVHGVFLCCLVEPHEAWTGLNSLFAPSKEPSLQLWCVTCLCMAINPSFVMKNAATYLYPVSIESSVGTRDIAYKTNRLFVIREIFTTGHWQSSHSEFNSPWVLISYTTRNKFVNDLFASLRHWSSFVSDMKVLYTEITPDKQK
jgi:hypothetical protein